MHIDVFWAFTFNHALLTVSNDIIQNPSSQENVFFFLKHNKKENVQWMHTSLCSNDVITASADLAILYSKCQTKATIQKMYTLPKGYISVLLDHWSEISS